MKAFDTASHSILFFKLRRCEQEKRAARNLSGLVDTEDCNQWLDVWLVEGDEQNSLVLCTSTLGYMLFTLLISDLGCDTPSVLSKITD